MGTMKDITKPQRTTPASLKLAVQLRRPFTEECKPVLTPCLGVRVLTSTAAPMFSGNQKLEDSLRDDFLEGSKDA